MSSTTLSTSVAQTEPTATSASTTTTRRPRRMAREAEVLAQLIPPPGKLDQLAVLLRRSEGASLAELMAATGWQQHSVRGAIAGALRKRGLVITSDKAGGERRYRASEQ